MPNVVGAIDCTHIPLAAPSVNPEQYVNRKGNFTINTQLVVNHRGAITNVVARWPGSVHDSRILKESYLQRALENRMLGEYFLIGILLMSFLICNATTLHLYLLLTFA